MKPTSLTRKVILKIGSKFYNAGASAIDIGGHYISDDPAQPNLWQIPTSNPVLTTIQPGGFLLLWPDKDTEDGELHIDLKLGSGGEELSPICPRWHHLARPAHLRCSKC